eukprot:CAMPEP_0171208408 /NCGR_PEP_ID=MMETSP0790-20130122/28072_1 /TAXON_ID=2925 /ORGANISM="Alexandrium catenella, Strain OF101" /LENGTH=455 /DNA_ID=CAMNT_0011674001 /DNA_START=1 /DNA_END=1366 /DNA_ORIENTATION=-
MTALSAAAIPKISDFGLQGLANTAWAYASLAFADRPLRHAIASAALRKIAHCRASAVEIGPGEAKSLLGLVSAFSEDGAGEPELQAALIHAIEPTLRSYTSHLDARGLQGTPPDAMDINMRGNGDESRPRVLVEQTHVLVLAKPPGWTVTVNFDDWREERREEAQVAQGVASNKVGADRDPRSRRVQDWVAENLGPLFPVLQDGRAQHGLVHRLDRETSGVLLVAKSYQGLELSRLQFVARRVLKEYVCLCHSGFPKAPRLLESSLRQLLVGGAAVSEGTTPRGAAVDEAGKNAKTEVLAVAHLRCPAGGRLSLVRLRLHTGRRHQIRAHMAAEGAPLVADDAYGGLARPWCRRIFLHAHCLSVDVGDGPLKALCRLPPDLNEALEVLTPESRLDQGVQKEWLTAEQRRRRTACALDRDVRADQRATATNTSGSRHSPFDGWAAWRSGFVGGVFR